MPFRWYCNKYMCFFCCCPLDNYHKLKQHTKSEHEEPKLKNILAALKNTRIKLDVSDISCKRCSKSVHSLEDFLAHAETAHDLNFNRDLSKDFFSYKLSEGDLNCLECGESFRFFGTLMMHTHKYHNKSNTYVCEICGQSFVSKLNVACHIKSVHGPHECNKCHKVFASRNNLKVHLSTVHKDGNMKCPKCPKILTSRYLKKRHLALDHNVQSSQHKCDLCTKVFTTTCILLDHKARVHYKERSVACEICGFKVFDKDELKRHMVRHDDSRPFQCDICEKSFQRKKTLDYHRRTHTNDKRHACKECGKAFVQVASLKLHIRVHHSRNETR